MQRVAVIDYGMGNLRSVSKAVEHAAAGAAEVVVTHDAAVVASADRVVFPGQGAIRDCMRELAAAGLEAAVTAAIDDRPFLGICIGLQALFESSEEHSETRGLGLLPGTVRRFPTDGRDPDTGERLKIPHMGWNQVRQVRDHSIWSGIADGSNFYFVHSYYVAPADERIVAGRTRHGVEFTCAIARDNLFAVQFHPEKSAADGQRLLANFLAWNGRE